MLSGSADVAEQLLATVEQNMAFKLDGEKTLAELAYTSTSIIEVPEEEDKQKENESGS